MTAIQRWLVEEALLFKYSTSDTALWFVSPASNPSAFNFQVCQRYIGKRGDVIEFSPQFLLKQGLLAFQGHAKVSSGARCLREAIS